MTDLRAGVQGRPPLDGRLEPWMSELLADAGGCAALVDRFGSPVNLIHPATMGRNAKQLVEAGRRAGVEIGLFFARKANKALTLVDEIVRLGHGVDVAGEAELQQTLQRGVPGRRIILSAAIKPERLLRLAVASGVTISLDSAPEAAAVAALATELGTIAQVAPRLAPDTGQGLPPTRFGAPSAAWSEVLAPGFGLAVAGVHFHLHGYRAADRAAMLAEAIGLVGRLREQGHRPEFVDIGGGVPISYLDDGEQWRAFWAAHGASATRGDEQITWKNAELRSVYPFHQQPVRGDWLSELLAAPLGSGTVATALQAAGLRLHLEPGRALVDGCGLTLARVSFVKRRSDGVGLVGVEMNRTQCRSTSDDFLVDPILVRSTPSGPPWDGFLVGAYCIEDELLLLRRMHFPHGVAPGDLIGLVNTGGYLMHILESASHQIPLARNVVCERGGHEPDPIDHWTSDSGSAVRPRPTVQHPHASSSS